MTPLQLSNSKFYIITLTANMRYSAVASLAFVGAVAAQNSTTGAAATGCVASYNTCRTTRTNGVSANQAQCASDNASCQGTCYATYNTCRTTPVDGASANQAGCASDYATCLGENPFSSDGSLTIIPYTASASMTSSAASPASTAACQTSYDQCRVGPDANMAFCASQFASCLGTNPFASNGTNTVTSAAGGVVYTTEVVTALTTVCPAPTAGAYVTTLGKNVYTVSSATTITVKDCPCTISKPVTSAPAASACATQLFDGCNPARSACPNGPGSYITVTPSTYPTSYVVNGQTVSFTAAPTSCLPSSAATTNGVMTPSAGGNKNGTASATKPAVYTGAAAQFGAGFGFLGAAAGAVMLL
ncbi:hypothetical protein D6D19_07700 [Aureobasidium pullulans]|uniref:Uncharacterized protein n=1 Tax=Aureobasidium pullulans TaxID=5580 RepID=A0A4S8ZW21_AURPU|nr:hypothetical protein D6D19_07700 [Aureobasidium pullulans]THY13018.1 hypothetical protein D6D00_10300 [Aureobasidium pullulans]